MTDILTAIAVVLVAVFALIGAVLFGTFVGAFLGTERIGDRNLSWPITDASQITPDVDRESFDGLELGANLTANTVQDVSLGKRIQADQKLAVDDRPSLRHRIGCSGH